MTAGFGDWVRVRSDPDAPEATAAYRKLRSSLAVDVPWRPEMGTQFHGPHPAMRRAGAEAIEWRRPAPGPGERVRVLAHTCECLAMVYELCGAGGSYFIRKTLRGPGETGDQVWESSRVCYRLAERRWFLLLRGMAR